MEGDPLSLSREKPQFSARTPLVWTQKVFFLAALAAGVALAIRHPWALAKAFVLFSTVFYLVYALYKLMLVRYSIVRDAEIRVSEAEWAALREDDLPVYSILVPMYHEGESVAHLVDALDRLDYPRNKKDVQLLLEEDDEETRRAVDGLVLPPGFRVTVAPDSKPKTKPKACNIGLDKARGEYLVIYDAEDRPERDQLKKAVLGFRQSDSRVICLQSRLNFYNPRQNLLTRWFALEYSTWFDLALPGLSALNGVIPLGGTSNHFVTARLRDLLGWDAFNVTEDCDLGVRIYRSGYRSRMLNTTTWEEACGSLPFWIRQRTRWLKGYIQTYLVHMRNPWRLFRDLGLANFLHFQMLIGGSVFSFLINPLFWALAIVWFVLRSEYLMVLFPGLVFAMGALCLFAGNFVFVYTGAVAAHKRGYFDVVKYALLMPLHWLLISFSGWRAFFQFFTNPFQWEKTRHGLFRPPPGENEKGATPRP